MLPSTPLLATSIGPVLETLSIVGTFVFAASGALAAAVCDRVNAGMGLVVLHSGHFSKVFKRLMGTPCTLRWRAVQEPLTLRGEFQEDFVPQCRDLGMAMAAGLEAGVF